MKIRKSIKKILALGAGASMIGATMLGAMAAADLASYPEPFVKDGKFNGVLVVGDKAAAEDVIGVSDIAVSLQFAATKKAATGTGSVTLSGDNVKIEKSGDVLELNELLANVTESLTGEDAKALKSYQVTTDKGTTDVNQYLRFGWGTWSSTATNGLQNGWTTAKVLFQNDDEDNVQDFLYFPDGAYAFQYELEFAQGYESDTSGTALDLDDLESEKLNLLGQEFEVTKATWSSTTSKLRLEMMGGAISDTFQEGETKTYTLNGKDYEVTNTIITDTGTVYAKFVVNGETSDKLQEGGTDTLKDGTIIGVNDILPNEAGDVTSDLVEVFFGANRVVFEDTATTTGGTDGSIEINSENIEDAEVNIDYTNSSTSSIKINKITYTLTVDGKSGDEPFMKKGEGLRQFLDEPQGMIADNWDIKYEGLSNPGVSKVKIASSGDDEYRLSFTNTQGVNYDNLRFLYATGTSLIFGDDTDALVYEQVKPDNQGVNFSNYTIHKDDYFIVCHACRSDTGVTRVLQFDNVDTGNKEIQLTDKGNGAQITAIYSNGNANFGNGTFNVGGYTFDFAVWTNNDTTDDANKLLWVDLDDDGVLGGTAAIVVDGGGWIDLITNASGTALNNSFNYRAPQASGAAYIYLNTDRTNFDEAPAANEVVNITFTSAASVIDLGVTTDSAIGLSPKTPEYDDDLTIGMTNYGVKTTETTKTSDPDSLEIEYPKSQLLGQAFVSFGASQTQSVSSGDAVVIQKIEVGATKLASEVSNIKNVNAILVGGPCANAATAEVMGNPADCTEGFEAGVGNIKLFENDGKVAMVVAGYSAADTRNAAAVVANYKDYKLTGTDVKVSRVNNALTVTS